MTDITHLLVCSKNRESGTSTNFRVKPCYSLRNLKTIELLEVSIPNTVYNVVSGANGFIIDQGSGNETATITPGSYNVDTFVAALEAALNALGGHTYTVTVNATTFRLTITDTTGTFTWAPGGGLAYVMGWNDIATPTTASSFTSTYAMGLHAPKSYMIMVDEFTGKAMSTGSGRRVTFILQSKVNSGNIELWSKNSDYNRIDVADVPTIDQLTISMFDQNGNTLDLQGADWQMLLKLTYLTHVVN